MSRPNVLLWGHEPRASGWTDPERVAAYMYDTSRGEGLDLRVPDAPFIIVETFCMGDHGIVSGYRKTPAGRIEPILSAETNSATVAWGLEVYRSVLYAFCDALDGNHDGDVRPLVHEVMDAFWCHPTIEEAEAWGSYPYDSDPSGTAARKLAQAFTPGPGSPRRLAQGRQSVAGGITGPQPADCQDRANEDRRIGSGLGWGTRYRLRGVGSPGITNPLPQQVRVPLAVMDATRERFPALVSFRRPGGLPMTVNGRGTCSHP